MFLLTLALMWRTGGCRTRVRGQPATPAPAEAPQRWETQVSGEASKVSPMLFLHGDESHDLCPLSTAGQRRDVPTHCGRGSYQDELPTLDPPPGQDRHRPRGVRTPSRFGNVRHAVAAGAQPGVWRPEGGASHLGRRAALPDGAAHHHRWERAGYAHARRGFVLNAVLTINPAEIFSVNESVWLPHRGELQRAVLQYWKEFLAFLDKMEARKIPKQSVSVAKSNTDGLGGCMAAGCTIT